MKEAEVGTLDCTVIIPVHDDGEGALACLEALRRQDLSPDRFEVVFCDNASREPITEAQVGSAVLPAVHIITTNDPGSYRARNEGLKIARGRILAFTDADCRPDPKWLSTGLHDLDTQRLDICAGRVQVTMRERPTPVEVWEKRNAFPQRKYVASMSFGVTANLFVRRSVFEVSGPFSEVLMSGGDRELCQRAVGDGARIGYSEGAQVSHPARTSAGEVVKKTRRVLQGARDMGQPAPTLRRWLRSAVPPLGVVGRSLSMPTARLRVLYVLGEVQAHYIRWWLTRQVARG